MSALRRIDELQADLALCGLEEAERAELRELTLAGDGSDESLELAAAAVMVGMMNGELEQIPSDVLGRLEAIAQKYVAQVTKREADGKLHG